MSAHKTERLLNLVICLLSTRQFLAKEQIRTAVPQYVDCPSDEAFDRMFERDKEELRDMGIPLETGGNDAWFDDEVGYRSHALPEVSFTPDELAVLGLASRVWQQASLAAPASRAVLKLKAAGVEPDLQPGRHRAAGPHQRAGLRAGVRRGARPASDPVRLPHAGPAGRHRAAPRAVGHRVPARRWYVVGHDRDRGATRVFRLSRVAGPVRSVGRDGEVQVPEGIDLRAQVATLVPTRPTARPGCASGRAPGPAPEPGHRGRRGGARGGGGPTAWDELTVPYSDLEVLAEEVAGHGADVQVVDPPELRDAVVRRLRGAGDAAPAAVGPRPRRWRPVSPGATDRLSRLLALVPYLVQPAGHPARRGRRRVRHHRGAAGQGPGAAVRLRHARPPARRPDRGRLGRRPRLPQQRRRRSPGRCGSGVDEALALLVGLRALADVPGLHDRDALERTLLKLEARPASPRQPAPRCGSRSRPRGRWPRSGARWPSGRRVHLTYFVPARDETTERTSTRCGCCSSTAGGTSRAGAAGPRTSGCSGWTGSRR